jgi:hypothetical protein
VAAWLARCSHPGRALAAKMLRGWRRAMVESDYLAGCPIVATITDAAANDELRDAAAQAFDRWSVALAAAHARRD